MMTHANRASQAVSQVLAGSSDREAAVDEFRTYTMMLLAVAPVLIDNKITRNFLEQAQQLDERNGLGAYRAHRGAQARNILGHPA